MDYVAADESEYTAVMIGLYSAAHSWPGIWDGTTYLDMLKAALPADGIGAQANEMLGKWITSDGQLLASCLMVTMVMGLMDSMRYVKKAVAGDKLADWWSEAMVNAVRDLLPYLAFLLAMFKWATLLSVKLDDPNTQLLFVLGTSAAFSRMCLELIHDTLTKLPIPMIFAEMALPIVGIYVATSQPEYDLVYIQCADCTPTAARPSPRLCSLSLARSLARSLSLPVGSRCAVPRLEAACCLACATDSAVVSFGLFAIKIAGIGLCYAQAVGVNLIMPPDYGPDGKAIRLTF